MFTFVVVLEATGGEVYSAGGSPGIAVGTDVKGQGGAGCMGELGRCGEGVVVSEVRT